MLSKRYSDQRRATDIYMHKGGIGVVANASAMERQRRVSQAGGAHARDANINRHCLRVQTMSRNVVSVSPQKFIAPRRAVAGNDIDFIVGMPEFRLNIVKQIKQPRIVMEYVSGPPIFQIFIETSESLWNVTVSSAIDNIEPLSSVRVEEPQPIFWSRGNCGGGMRSRKHP